MKRSTFVLVLCFAAVYSQNTWPIALQEAFARVAGKCISETGADPTLVAQLEAGDPIEDTNVKCFIKCVMVEIGGMDVDGTVHLDSMRVFFPTGEIQEQVMEFAEKCKDEAGVDACETAYAIHMCGMELMKVDEDR